MKQSRAEAIVILIYMVTVAIYFVNMESWGSRGVWLVVGVMALGSAYLVGQGIRTGDQPLMARYGIGLIMLLVILLLFPNAFG